MSLVQGNYCSKGIMSFFPGGAHTFVKIVNVLELILAISNYDAVEHKEYFA